ncbi:hypothetical protein Vretifemale_15336, partial [Volvox reticuliferus]
FKYSNNNSGGQHIDIGIGFERRCGAIGIGGLAASPARPMGQCMGKDNRTLHVDHRSCEVLHTRRQQFVDATPSCRRPMVSADLTPHPQLPEHSSGLPQRHRLQCPFPSHGSQSNEQRLVQYNSVEPASSCTSISTVAPAYSLAAVDSTGPLIMVGTSLTTLVEQQESSSRSGGDSGGCDGCSTSETMESAAAAPFPPIDVNLAEKVSPSPRPRLGPGGCIIRSQLEGQPVTAAFHPTTVPERKVSTQAFSGPSFRTTWSAVELEPLDELAASGALPLRAGGDGAIGVGLHRSSCSSWYCCDGRTSRSNRTSRTSSSLQRRRLETVSSHGAGEAEAAATAAAPAAAVPAAVIADADGVIFPTPWRAVYSSCKVDTPEALMKGGKGVKARDESESGDLDAILQQSSALPQRSSLDYPPGSTALDRYAALTAQSPSWKYTAMYDMHDAMLLARLTNNRRSRQGGMMVASCTGAVSRVESRQMAAAAAAAAPAAAVAGAAAASPLPFTSSVGSDNFGANGGFVSCHFQDSPARYGPADGSESSGARRTAVSTTSYSLGIKGGGGGATQQVGEFPPMCRSACIAPIVAPSLSQPPATAIATVNATSAATVAIPASPPRSSHGAAASSVADVAAAAAASDAASGCGQGVADGGSPHSHTGSRSSPAPGDPDKKCDSGFRFRSPFRSLIWWLSNETTTLGAGAAAAGSKGRVALQDRGVVTPVNVNVTGSGGSCTSAGEREEGVSERRQRPTEVALKERSLVSWNDTLQALRYQAIHGA